MVLGTAQQHIAGRRAFEPRLEAAVVVQQHQCNALRREAVHQRCGEPDGAKADDALFKWCRARATSARGRV